MRDALYRNLEGHLFKTLAYEDQKVLVLNDPKEKYRYLLEDAWDDLKIEKEEEARIERNKGFTDLEVDQKEKNRDGPSRLWLMEGSSRSH